MKIRPHQLKEHFSKKQLLPLYIVSGDEPLLMQEVADQIRLCTRKAGLTERELFQVETGFDWNNLLEANNSMSLFGDRKLIEVRHPTGKFDDSAKKALLQYCENPNPDNVLLLVIPKLEKRSQTTKWFKTLESTGAFVQIWPIQLSQMPQWIQQRMHSSGLQPTPEAVEMLTERVEGNLLAASQEIEKLVLLQGEGPVDGQDIEASVADHARYNLYDMVDEAIAGHHVHALKMLNQLRASGMEPAILLWALSKELRALASMSESVLNGQSVSRVMQEHRVWENRKNNIQSALQRLSGNTFKHCLLQAARIDQSIKGMHAGNPWDGFNSIVLWLSGQIKPGRLGL